MFLPGIRTQKSFSPPPLPKRGAHLEFPPSLGGGHPAPHGYSKHSLNPGTACTGSLRLQEQTHAQLVASNQTDLCLAVLEPRSPTEVVLG